MYFQTFQLPNESQEHDIICYYETRNIHTSYYPLGIFPPKQLKQITFELITIFCGDNGSGKTTLLNVIAEQLQARRKTIIDKGSYFHHYVESCHAKCDNETLKEIKMITSDDVFDSLSDIRSFNTEVNQEKELLSQQYRKAKYHDPNKRFQSYKELKDTCDARRQTMSKYIRGRLNSQTIPEFSNGETALTFWQREIREDGLYLLDEPENSLSAENQLRLKQYIEDSVRFYHCQFIIATHSPFLLNLKQAKIYDLDVTPVTTKNWTDVQNVKVYYQFFAEKQNEFEKKEETNNGKVSKRF
ncbi:MAG: AAA family ATPase [Erysipelotrichaceae bacterium]|nr:AAA family ATPase [Erysipelotrichaceae bacterium]